MQTANPQSDNATKASANSALPVRTLIDNYRVVKSNAVDEMSITYEAIDQRNDEIVCLREFFPHRLVERGADGVTATAKSPTDTQAFSHALTLASDACRTLAEISDRGTVPLGPSIDANGTRYQVTRPQGLATLRGSLTRRHQPITSAQLNTLMQRLLKTVRTLHDAGLVHGAISPETILVNEALEPFLHISLFDRNGNHANQDVTSTPYLYETEPCVALDLYALGASFYHCVAGVGPVELSARLEELDEGEDDPMMSAMELGEGTYAKTTLRCIDWLLAPEPIDRPLTADDVLQVVSGFAKIGKHGQVKRASNKSGDPRLNERRWSWRWLIPVGSFAALVGATWLGFVTLKPWVTERFAWQDTTDSPSVVVAPPAPINTVDTRAPDKATAATPAVQSVIQPPPSVVSTGSEDEPADAVQLTQDTDLERINQYREQLEKEQLEKQIQSRIAASVQAKVNELDEERTRLVTERRAKARAHVERADLALGKGELLQPEVGALALYRQALSEDADNAEAFGGVVAVASALTERAQAALNNGETNEAEKWAAVSSSVFSDQSALPALLSAIERRKEQDQAQAAVELESQNEAVEQRLADFVGEVEKEDQRQGQIKELLVLANDAFTRGDILEPADSGAVALFRRILEIDSQSVAAEQGLARCIGWYADKAIDAAVDNDIPKAQRFATRAKQINDEHPIVRILEKQLKEREALIKQFAERETLLQSETDAARIQIDQVREQLRAAQKNQADAIAAAVEQAQQAQAKQQAQVAAAPVTPTPQPQAAQPAPTQPIVQPPAPAEDIVQLGEAISSYYSADYPRAFQLLEPLAEQGSARAQFRLAVMYFLGRGAPRDPVTAGAWLNRSSARVRSAASAGTAWAESDLGQMYEEGWSVPQSYETAARWYRRAATKGYAGAQNNLGVLYEQGLGVPRDRDQAVAWLRRAASQGDSVARENLATLGVRP